MAFSADCYDFMGVCVVTAGGSCASKYFTFTFTFPYAVS